MTVLIIAGVLLALIAVWFVTRPLWRAPAPAQTLQPLLMLRDRLLAQLHEVEAARADQSMDGAVAAAEQARLEYELAQVLKQIETPAAAAAGAPRVRAWAIAAGLLLIPIAAGVLYWQQNRAALMVAQDYHPDAPQTAQEPLPPMVMEMVARLEQRLKTQPNDPQGWAQLGRSYSVLNRRAEAEQAYAKAYAQAPDDMKIVSDYAWLLYSAEPTRPSVLSVKLYSELYRRDRSNQDAQWVLGLAAYQAGRRDQAIDLWEQLLASLPPESPAAQGVRTALEQVKKTAKK